MIRIRQLEAFRAIMITGGVTAAAGMLNISQPAVSRLIAHLEQTLGFAVFQRRKGRLHPTQEASFLFDEVERVFATLEHISQISHDILHQKTGHLRIGCLPGFATSLMPKVVADFLSGRPDVTVSLQTRSSARVREWIAAQQYDVGIADEFDGHNAVEHEPFEIRGVCVVAANHRLAGHDIITPDDLDGEPMITNDRNHSFHIAVEQAFEAADVEMFRRVEVRQFATACLLANRGIGASIVSSIDAAEYATEGLVTIPFEPAISFKIDLLYPAYHPRPLLLREFTNLFKQALEPFRV
jgi:DNA-binding transcriptional LysR family regulator